MLKRSHASAAPWIIVRSNNKHAARMNVLKVIRVPYSNANPDLDFIPDPVIVVSGRKLTPWKEPSHKRKIQSLADKTL